jgi:probable rRNA maturation factor
MASIRFFSEETDFKLPHPRKTSTWIKSALKKEKKALGDLNFIFCTDEYLLQINIEYLDHHTYTDIITFDSSETPGTIEGDIFISIERIHENAGKFDRPFDEELHRVIIHGVLHLIGYGDKTKTAKIEMTKKENAYLAIRGV